MDTLAHGLWGGAAFSHKDGQWKWAFVLGMAPDLLSFGPFFLMRLGDISRRWTAGRMGPPEAHTIPEFVYHAYNITHSLLVWVAMFLVALYFLSLRKRTPLLRYSDTSLPLLPFLAWPLHILCDIPTHSTRFFPTPFLWPFPTTFFNGTSWGNKTFMIANYSAIAVAYLGYFLWKRRTRKPD